MDREIELSRFIHGSAREVSIGLRLHKSEVIMLDEVAAKLGITRSELIRSALRAVMQLKILEIDEEA